MLLGDIVDIFFLMLGSLSGLILSKLLLKFYSTILFADLNIFTHLNKAAVMAIQLMVQSRVGDGKECSSLSWIPQILIELISKTHPVPHFVAIPLRIGFLFGVHLLFAIFTFSTAFRMVLIFKASICTCHPSSFSFLSQTSTFSNMAHERVFHVVLLSIVTPFAVAVPATYIFDFLQHNCKIFFVLTVVTLLSQACVSPILRQSWLGTQRKYKLPLL